jgi:hypothetical protein
MINLLNDDFVKEFDEIYGDGAWAQSLERIKDMIVRLFNAVSVDTLPQSVESKPNTQKQGSAATIYGLDVMLTADLQPMLLECTFAPDCHRACVQYPSFFADVFSTLFEGKPRHFSRLPNQESLDVSYQPLAHTERHITTRVTVD